MKVVGIPLLALLFLSLAAIRTMNFSSFFNFIVVLIVFAGTLSPPREEEFGNDQSSDDLAVFAKLQNSYGNYMDDDDHDDSDDNCSDSISSDDENDDDDIFDGYDEDDDDNGSDGEIGWDDDDDDDDDECFDDDSLERRSDEFIAKLNKQWREERMTDMVLL